MWSYCSREVEIETYEYEWLLFGFKHNFKLMVKPTLKSMPESMVQTTKSFYIFQHAHNNWSLYSVLLQFQLLKKFVVVYEFINVN